MAAARVPDEARRWWETFSNGAPRVPDEARRWWETFSNGASVDEGEEEGEPDVDSDSSFEQEEDDGGQNADAVASESDRKMAAVRVARESTNGHSDGKRGTHIRSIYSRRSHLLQSCFVSRHDHLVWLSRFGKPRSNGGMMGNLGVQSSGGDA
jgi:hypothetical protein